QELLDSIKSQVIPLSVMDTEISFANIPFIFVYENTRDDGTEFMPSDRLLAAFYKTLSEFPIFLGDVKGDKTGQSSIVIDKDNLNWPDYKESQSDVDFGNIKEHGYHWKHWPQGLATCGPICVPSKADGRIKFANVHVVRLKDNSGLMLYLCIAHYAVDGTGYFTFANRWAELSSIGPNNAGTKQYSFDRSVITDTIAKLPKGKVDDRVLDIYRTPNAVASWLAWLSPKWRARLSSKISLIYKGEGHMYYISNRTLDSLRQQVSGHCPAGMRISHNDLLVALCSKVVAQAKKAHQEEASNGIASKVLGRLSASKKPTTQAIAIIVDTRHRIGITHENYTGNSIITQVIYNPLEQSELPTTPSSLASMAQAVRNSVDSIDIPMIAGFITMCNADPKCFARPLVHSALNENFLVLTNQVRFRVYDTDFGSGRPVFVTPPPDYVPDVVEFLPTPNSDGTYIHLCTAPKEMKHVLSNEFWNKHTQLIF
ncbi:hypothetical protein GGI12_004415, partial [Dipsacomyces acuminosporus]